MPPVSRSLLVVTMTSNLLCQRLQSHSFNENGRTDRASLQRVTRLYETLSYFF
jgi:hypothetical protein